MKKTKGLRTIAAFAAALMMAGTGVLPAAAAQDQAQPQKEYMNVGYAFRRGLDIEDLDLSKITHLNYSFGLVYNNEVPPDPNAELNPDCVTPDVAPGSPLLHTIYLPTKVKNDLKKLPELKKEKNPDLKVMLSVGGYNARGFSDAAATETARQRFAQSCKQVIDEYQLAGIDLDWEYPTIDWANIKTRPQDPQNFTLLLQAVRDAIGPDKLLSIAGSANVNFSSEWTEFEKVVELVDFINIMTYDFQYGTCYYGSPLYASTKWLTTNAEDEYNADMAIQRYIEMGCPPEKINMGLAFAAVTLPDALRKDGGWDVIEQNLTNCGFLTDRKTPALKKVKDYLENKTYVHKNEDGTETTYRFDKKWDASAQTSYIATYDQNGKELFVLSYIEPQGLTAKTDYVKKYGLGGTMFWEFGSDYGNLLTSQIARELDINPQLTKE